MSEKPFLTERELAATGIVGGMRTLQQWRLLHKGPPYIKVGRAVRYRMADVEKWLGQHTVDPRLEQAGRDLAAVERQMLLRSGFAPGPSTPPEQTEGEGKT